MVDRFLTELECLAFTCAMSTWDVPSNTDLFSPNWDRLERGTKISVVVDGCVHTGSMVVGTSIPDGMPIRILGVINNGVRGCHRLTLFDVVFDKCGTMVDLLLTDQSAVIAHGLKPVAEMFRCVELCAGVACSSVGLAAAGFRPVCSVEWRAPLVDLHRRTYPGMPVIHGDISNMSCIKEVAQCVDPPFTLMTGFSCQPYSSGGAQGGSDDDRSGTVPATVKACFLLQCPVMLIENVPHARTNQFVRSCLQQLVDKLGYHLSEVCLKLEDNWCARRFRWWLVAVHPSFGPVTLHDWPKNPSLNIRDVMPFIKPWPQDVLAELQLTDHEITKFTLDGSTLRKYHVQLDGKLPTSLHSCGSQADDCPCGCRNAFSDHLIRQRGIYAQLLQIPVATGAAVYRHLHPCELALLNGMPPPEAWMRSDRPSLRLCLGAIGQLASPLQSVWVGSCIMQQLCQVLDLPAVVPTEVFGDFKQRLLTCSRDMFPSLVTPQVHVDWTQLTYPDGTSVRVQVQAETTVIELFQAERALSQDATADHWIDAATGLPLDYFTKVSGLNILVQGVSHTDASSSTDQVVTAVPFVPIPLDFGDREQDVNDVPPTAMDLTGLDDSTAEGGDGRAPVVFDPPPVVDQPASVGVPAIDSPVMDTLLGLRFLSGTQLAALVPPLVSELQSCQMYRLAVVPVQSRLAILANEGRAMGDDEIALHLRACVRLCNRDEVEFLDPLLACGWLQNGTPEKAKEWMLQHPAVSCIVTVVHVNGHWMPVVWSAGLTEVQVAMWEHTDVDIDCLNPLHGLIAQAWGKPMFTLACTRRSYAKEYCGAAAIAFVSHRLLSHDLPASELALESLHNDLKGSFAEACRSAVALPKPWCWGLGTPDVIGLTSELLQSHGVPGAQSMLRAKLVVQALGRTEVQKALHGVSPWKSLKQLANLQKPPLQMVLPDEQAQLVAQRPASKQKKNQSAAKLMPSRPAELDPSKLLIEHGAFRVGDDDAVGQVPFSSIGPLACGVVLANFPDALPFLQSGQLLTNHGLALLVLNAPCDLQTSLSWSTIRFAARCSVNQEPMLVSGVLVQLGRSVIYQFKAKDTPVILSVDVACARVTVYQDQWEGSWEDFAAKPVKHVLSVLSCLQTCRNGAECQCPSWHPDPANSHDAVLDVFRRQFFNDSGRSVKWDKASHFAVMLRYAKSLEMHVLCASGQHGVFIEPKTEDALRPHDDFQVVWLPHLDFSSVAHKAKCEVDSLGVARSGRRFGIRVHVKNFQRIFTSVKPDAVYLAPGSRLTFHCGPWPFGSDRKSIARILKATGWECRPLQPIQHVTGGLMWSVQAVVNPPNNVMSMQHGQIVITSPAGKPGPAEPAAQVVGQAKTVDMCRPTEQAGSDPWLTNDPWSKAVHAAPAVPMAAPAQHVLQEIEQRLEQTLLAKLPVSERMEVDDQDQRLQMLESQVQQLASRQTSLEATVQDNHQQNTAQVQSLQQQMKVQLDMQTHQMQNMLTDQMSRIETILAKKPRTE